MTQIILYLRGTENKHWLLPWMWWSQAKSAEYQLQKLLRANSFWFAAERVMQLNHMPPYQSMKEEHLANAKRSIMNPLSNMPPAYLEYLNRYRYDLYNRYEMADYC